MPYLPPPSNSPRLQRPNRPGYGIQPSFAVEGSAGAAAAAPQSQFLEYWRVMRANILWIGLLAVAGAGLGWLIAMLQPSMYQSKTVLDIRSLNENILNPRDGAPIGTTGSVRPESYIQTEIKILSSDSLRKRALARLLALQPPTHAQPVDPPPFWRSIFGIFDATAPFKTVAADAANRVKVRAVGNTRIVEVLCDARDGQLAANMCNNLAKAYIEYNLESREQSTKETGDWLQSQLDDVRRRLTKAENDLKDSSKAAGSGSFLFDAGASNNPAEDKLRQLQSELSRFQTERISKESDYIIAAARSADSLPLAMDSGPIREYRMRLNELKRQLAELSSTMTPEHYKVRELQMQISEVERALKKERDDLIDRLKADYETAQRRESIFASAFEKQAAQVSQNSDQAVRYNMLKREVDSDRHLYETLLQRTGEVGLSAALRTSTISVVDPAAPAELPYSPKVLTNVGIGVLGGSIIGLAFSLVRLRADRTFHGPGEAAAYLQLRELGVIPQIRGKRVRTLLGRMTSAPAKLRTSIPLDGSALEKAQRVAVSQNAARSVAMATWLKVPKIAEAFFGTMSSLRFATERGERAGVIVLTSPDANEGKTTVATNLAIALALIGRRVILVDGDLRKPGIDRIFETQCEGGLAELLETEESIEVMSLSKYVVATPIRNLSVLPTRADPDGICTKLHSSRMSLLIERLRQEYDSVIIDSPPMLHIADGRVLGWLADGVLLVLRARKTTRDSALAAYECLVQDGIHVLGTVLNDWNPRKGEQYATYKSYLRAG